MWDKDDPKSKWFHLVVKLIVALLIFKLGVMVGEFKIIKAMVLRGGAHQKMMFSGDDEVPGAGARFFTKRLMPGDMDDMMFWRGRPAPEAGTVQPAPAPQP